MAWEYLQTEALDRRFQEVAKRVDVAGKVIVDVNCGTARFCNHITPTFLKYFGNDVQQWVTPKRVHFQLLPDSSVPHVLMGHAVDILCCFGHGAGHVHPCKLESPTLTSTIKTLVQQKLPEIVIIEGSTDYNHRFNMLDELMEFCESEDYRQEHAIRVERVEGVPHSQRLIYIMQRGERKVRRCLRCGEDFVSESAGNRICEHCGAAVARTYMPETSVQPNAIGAGRGA